METIPLCSSSVKLLITSIFRCFMNAGLLRRLNRCLCHQMETPAEAVDIMDTSHAQLAFTGIHIPM